MMLKTAALSRCGRFRYLLERTWDLDLPIAMFVMLNPSTADASTDDPTIRRCIGFAQRWGKGGIRVVSLYAYRATSPADLKAAGYPEGPDNAHTIGDALAELEPDDVLVMAWGANFPSESRDPEELANWLDGAAGRVRAQCFGYTQDGQPLHPLYLPADAQLEPWPPGPFGAHAAECRHKSWPDCQCGAIPTCPNCGAPLRADSLGICDKCSTVTEIRDLGLDNLVRRSLRVTSRGELG